MDAISHMTKQVKRLSTFVCVFFQQRLCTIMYIPTPCKPFSMLDGGMKSIFLERRHRFPSSGFNPCGEDCPLSKGTYKKD